MLRSNVPFHCLKHVQQLVLRVFLCQQMTCISRIQGIYLSSQTHGKTEAQIMDDDLLRTDMYTTS